MITDLQDDVVTPNVMQLGDGPLTDIGVEPGSVLRDEWDGVSDAITMQARSAEKARKMQQLVDVAFAKAGDKEAAKRVESDALLGWALTAEAAADAENTEDVLGTQLARRYGTGDPGAVWDAMNASADYEYEQMPVWNTRAEGMRLVWGRFQKMVQGKKAAADAAQAAVNERLKGLEAFVDGKDAKRDEGGKLADDAITDGRLWELVNQGVLELADVQRAQKVREFMRRYVRPLGKRAEMDERMRGLDGLRDEVYELIGEDKDTARLFYESLMRWAGEQRGKNDTGAGDEFQVAVGKKLSDWARAVDEVAPLALLSVGAPGPVAPALVEQAVGTYEARRDKNERQRLSSGILRAGIDEAMKVPEGGWWQSVKNAPRVAAAMAGDTLPYLVPFVGAGLGTADAFVRGFTSGIDAKVLDAELGRNQGGWESRKAMGNAAMVESGIQALVELMPWSRVGGKGLAASVGRKMKAVTGGKYVPGALSRALARGTQKSVTRALVAEFGANVVTEGVLEPIAQGALTLTAEGVMDLAGVEHGRSKSFSEAFAELGEIWEPEQLAGFLMFSAALTGPAYGQSRKNVQLYQANVKEFAKNAEAWETQGLSRAEAEEAAGAEDPVERGRELVNDGWQKDPEGMLARLVQKHKELKESGRTIVFAGVQGNFGFDADTVKLLGEAWRASQKRFHLPEVELLGDGRVRLTREEIPGVIDAVDLTLTAEQADAFLFQEIARLDAELLKDWQKSGGNADEYQSVQVKLADLVDRATGDVAVDAAVAEGSMDVEAMGKGLPEDLRALIQEAGGINLGVAKKISEWAIGQMEALEAGGMSRAEAREQVASEEGGATLEVLAGMGASMQKRLEAAGDMSLRSALNRRRGGRRVAFNGRSVLGSVLVHARGGATGMNAVEDISESVFDMMVQGRTEAILENQAAARKAAGEAERPATLTEARDAEAQAWKELAEVASKAREALLKVDPDMAIEEVDGSRLNTIEALSTMALGRYLNSAVLPRWMSGLVDVMRKNVQAAAAVVQLQKAMVALGEQDAGALKDLLEFLDDAGVQVGKSLAGARVEAVADRIRDLARWNAGADAAGPGGVGGMSVSQAQEEVLEEEDEIQQNDRARETVAAAKPADAAKREDAEDKRMFEQEAGRGSVPERMRGVFVGDAAVYNAAGDFWCGQVEKNKLSDGTEQVKVGEKGKHGVIAGKELTGRFVNDTAPILVWKRRDGSLQVISGRHRFAKLMEDESATGVMCYVYEESEERDERWARMKDYEQNMRDDQADEVTCAVYARETGLTEAEMRERGLTRNGSRSKRGIFIGQHAREELWTRFRNGEIKPMDAELVCKLTAALADQSQVAEIQAHCCGLLKAGKSWDYIGASVQLMASSQAQQAEQMLLDLGADFTANLEKMARWVELCRKAFREAIDLLKDEKRRVKKGAKASRLGLSATMTDEKREEMLGDLEAMDAKFEMIGSYPELVAEAKLWDGDESKFADPVAMYLERVEAMQAEGLQEEQNRNAAEEATGMFNWSSSLTGGGKLEDNQVKISNKAIVTFKDGVVRNKNSRVLRSDGREEWARFPEIEELKEAGFLAGNVYMPVGDATYGFIHVVSRHAAEFAELYPGATQAEALELFIDDVFYNLKKVRGSYVGKGKKKKMDADSLVYENKNGNKKKKRVSMTLHKVAGESFYTVDTAFETAADKEFSRVKVEKDGQSCTVTVELDGKAPGLPTGDTLNPSSARPLPARRPVTSDDITPDSNVKAEDIDFEFLRKAKHPDVETGARTRGNGNFSASVTGGKNLAALRENGIKPVWHDGTGEGRRAALAGLVDNPAVSFSVIGRNAKTWGKYTDKAFAGRDDGKWRAEIDASQAKLKWEDLRGKNVTAYRRMVAGWDKLPEDVRKAVEAYAEEVYDWKEESDKLNSTPESEFLEQYNKVQKMRDAIKPKREEMRSLLNKLFVEHGGGAAAVLNMKDGELDELAMSLWGPYVEDKVEKALDLRPLWHGGMRLADVMDYPELYEAYPELADVVVRYVGMETANGRAIYGNGEPEILINRNLEGEWEKIHSILLHEIQHHIQYIEGFAKGGNPKSARQVLKDKLESMQGSIDWLVRDLRWFSAVEIARDLLKEARMLLKYPNAWKRSGQRFRFARYGDSSEEVREKLVRDVEERYNEFLQDDTTETLLIDLDAYVLPHVQFSSLVSIEAGLAALDKAPSRKLAFRGTAARKSRKLADLQKRHAVMKKVLSEFGYEPYELYLRLAGEIEARNVQHRMDWSADKRAAVPFNDTLEYPGEALVTFSVQRKRDLTLDGERVTKKEAWNHLEGLAGKPLRNARSKFVAVVNKPQRKELTDLSKAWKSANNGFSIAAHYAAVSRIEKLFEHAVSCGEYPDLKHGEQTVHIHRFACPLMIDGEKAVAWLTAKQTTNVVGSERLYNLELVDIEKLAGNLEYLASHRLDTALPAASGNIVAEVEEAFKTYFEDVPEVGSNFSSSLTGAASRVLEDSGDEYVANRLREAWQKNLEKWSVLNAGKADASSAMRAVMEMEGLVKATYDVVQDDVKLGRLYMLQRWAMVYARMVESGELPPKGALKGPAYEKFVERLAEQQRTERRRGMSREQAEELVKELGVARLEGAMEKVARECMRAAEWHLKQKETARVKRLLEAAWPKREEGKKSPRGKLAAREYRRLEWIKKVMELSAEDKYKETQRIIREIEELPQELVGYEERVAELEGKLAALDPKQADYVERKAELDKAMRELNPNEVGYDEAKAELEDQLNWLHVFGGWAEMDVTQARKAAKALEDLLLRGRTEWELKLQRERERTRKVALEISSHFDAKWYETTAVRKADADTMGTNKAKMLKGLKWGLMGYAQTMLALRRKLGKVFCDRQRRTLAEAHRNLLTAQKDLQDWTQMELQKITGLTGAALEQWIAGNNQNVNTGIMMHKVRTESVRMSAKEVDRLMAMGSEEYEAWLAEEYAKAEVDGRAVVLPTREELLRLADLRRENPRRQKLEVMRTEDNKVPLVATKEALLYAVLLFEQPDYEHLVEAHGLTGEDVDAMKKIIGPKLLRWGYAMRRHLNENGELLAAKYEAWNGTPFGRRANYFRGVFDVNKLKPETDIIDEGAAANSLGGNKYSILIPRRYHRQQINWQVGASQVFMLTMNEQNNYIHTQHITREWRQLLSRKGFADGLSAEIGANAVNMIKLHLDVIDAAPRADAAMTSLFGRLVQGVMKATALSSLALNVYSYVKQVSCLLNAIVGGYVPDAVVKQSGVYQVLTYSGIGAGELIKSYGRVLRGKGSISFREMTGSRVIQSRIQSGGKRVADALMLRTGQKLPNAVGRAGEMSGEWALEQMDTIDRKANTVAAMVVADAVYRKLAATEAGQAAGDKWLRAQAEEAAGLMVDLVAQPKLRTQKGLWASHGGFFGGVGNFFYMFRSESLAKIGTYIAQMSSGDYAKALGGFMSMGVGLWFVNLLCSYLKGQIDGDDLDDTEDVLKFARKSVAEIIFGDLASLPIVGGGIGAAKAWAGGTWHYVQDPLQMFLPVTDLWKRPKQLYTAVDKDGIWSFKAMRALCNCLRVGGNASGWGLGSGSAVMSSAAGIILGAAVMGNAGRFVMDVAERVTEE